MTAQFAANDQHTVQQIWEWLTEIPDPEIPVLSLIDLGIVRRVTALPDGVEVEVAPTYSGCPATEVIEKASWTACWIEAWAMLS